MQYAPGSRGGLREVGEPVRRTQISVGLIFEYRPDRNQTPEESPSWEEHPAGSKRPCLKGPRSSEPAPFRGVRARFEPAACTQPGHQVGHHPADGALRQPEVTARAFVREPFGE